jgi:hypothetical protein
MPLVPFSKEIAQDIALLHRLSVDGNLSRLHFHNFIRLTIFHQ